MFPSKKKKRLMTNLEKCLQLRVLISLLFQALIIEKKMIKFLIQKLTRDMKRTQKRKLRCICVCVCV